MKTQVAIATIGDAAIPLQNKALRRLFFLWFLREQNSRYQVSRMISTRNETTIMRIISEKGSGKEFESLE